MVRRGQAAARRIWSCYRRRSQAFPPARRYRKGRVSRPAFRTLIGACAGDMVAWCGIFIYACLALHFAPSLFPDTDQTSQLVATAGVFAAGFSSDGTAARR